MAREHIGVAFHGHTAAGMLDAVKAAERAGVHTAWLTTGLGPDAMTVFAMAAAVTGTIRMGTAVVPTFPRHPVVVAQQSADIAAIAPGRFTLGVGPSHRPAMEIRYGIPYVKPLQHLREFVLVTKGLLRGEHVDFEGERYKVHGKLMHGADVPVIVSALRAGSFALAGEIADGAVTWLCPAPYLRDIAIPAMERGAAQAGRMRPRLVAHAFLALTTDAAALARGVEAYLPQYPRYFNYQEMFAAAGMPEAREREWSPRMVDASVIHGNDADCRRKLDAFLATSGADEMVLSIMPTGTDRLADQQRAIDWIGSL